MTERLDVGTYCDGCNCPSGGVKPDEALLAVITYRLMKGNPAMPPARDAIKELIQKAGLNPEKAPEKGKEKYSLTNRCF